MKEVTYIEFENGDVMPEWVTQVPDADGDMWTRIGDSTMFEFPDCIERTWDDFVRYNTVRFEKPSDSVLRETAQKLRDQAIELVKRADTLFPSPAVNTPRVWNVGDSEPSDNPQMEDCDGDVWERNHEGRWQYTGSDSTFSWRMVLKHAPLTEVL